MSEQRRLRISGLHHVTVICRDVERSVDFYRNLLGMRLVRQSVNDDDESARHLYFGDERGRPGTLVTCLEYPQLEDGRVGPGSTHHFALAVDSVEELHAWRDYLNSRGVSATEVMKRGPYSAIYMRDPDGHIVELAAGAAELLEE
jgi:catechol 2,3-dioxygenase-like lactoylglutathione lyase family enzyme